MVYGLGMSETAPQPLVYDSEVKLTERQRAFAAGRRDGMSVKELETAFKLKPRSGYTVQSHLNRKTLANPKLDRLATETIEKLIKGEATGSVKEVKCSTQLAACKTVKAITEPPIQRVETINVTLSVVDLDGYRGQATLEGGDGVLEGKVVSALPEDVETAEDGTQTARADGKGKELGEYG